MKIIFTPQAKEEFLHAISYYEDIRNDLGQRFKDEADRCILWIAEHYQFYRLRSGGYRRINLRIFPYHIPFIIRDDMLWVLAIASSSKKPEYWIDRKPN